LFDQEKSNKPLLIVIWFWRSSCF